VAAAQTRGGRRGWWPRSASVILLGPTYSRLKQVTAHQAGYAAAPTV
jgi:hypothetical protein